jgi:hypothetical protein
MEIRRKISFPRRFDLRDDRGRLELAVRRNHLWWTQFSRSPYKYAEEDRDEENGGE